MAEGTGQAAVFSVITSIDVIVEPEVAAVRELLIELQICGAQSPGFWSGEIMAPGGADNARWQLIQRFNSMDDAIGWKESLARHEVVKKLKSHAPGAIMSDDLSTGTNADVAAAIVTDLKPGKEDEFFRWERKIQTAQAKRQGFRGSYLQPPPPQQGGKWATIVRFDSPEALENWFVSEERKELLAEASELINKFILKKVPTSFPGWFPHDELTGQPPPNWKTAMLVLLGLYPVVMLELVFLMPLLSGMQLAMRSFIAMMGSVAATTWITIPVCIKLFRWWLFPKEESAWSVNATGVLIIAALYAGEVVCFLTKL